jgi:hypothetical protein
LNGNLAYSFPFRLIFELQQNSGNKIPVFPAALCGQKILCGGCIDHFDLNFRHVFIAA